MKKSVIFNNSIIYKLKNKQHILDMNSTLNEINQKIFENLKFIQLLFKICSLSEWTSEKMKIFTWFRDFTEVLSKGVELVIISGGTFPGRSL